MKTPSPPVRQNLQSNHFKASGNKKPKKGSGKKKKEQSSDDSAELELICQTCSEQFSDNALYSKHIKKCAKKSPKIVCPIKDCKKPFGQKIMFNQHFKFYHTDEPKDFVCNKCNSCFVYSKSFKVHNDRLHTDDSEKKFMCDSCGKLFTKQWEYSLHRRSSHTDIKPFKCGICNDAAFPTVGRLNNHLKSCGQEKEFYCQQCGKPFVTKWNLIRHVNDTHKKDMIWPCPICDKIYHSQGGFYTHLRVIHEISRDGNNSLKDLQLDKEIKVKREQYIADQEADTTNNSENGDSSKTDENTNSNDQSGDNSNVKTE